MGNINKKYIIREAENILEECRKKGRNYNVEKNKIIKLKIYNKRLKRKLLIWRICSISFVFLFIATLCAK